MDGIVLRSLFNPVQHAALWINKKLGQKDGLSDKNYL